MGDAADILGVKKEKKEAGFESALGGEAKARRRTAQPKPPNVSREVFALLKQQGETASASADGGGSAGPSNYMLPPMMPSSASSGAGGAVGFKGASRRGAANSKVKWTWGTYSNSARGGDTQPFYRWNKAGIEFQDYPYARFNVQMAKLEYSDQEYAEVVAPLSDSGRWTRAEDDALCRLAHAYSCRWPVIHDRWATTAPPSGVGSGGVAGAAPLPQRPAVDLQHRYCSMAQALLLARKRKLTADAQQAAAGAVAAAAAAPVPIAGGDQAPGAGSITAGAGAATAGAAGAAGVGAAVGSNPAMLAVDASNQSAMVAAKIEDQARALGIGLGLKYDKSLESERRALLEAAWQRSRPDDKTEDQLKEELKQVEAELRRVRKVIATKPSRGSRTTTAAAAATPSASSASPPPEATSSSSGVSQQLPESAAAAVAAETATATAHAFKAMSFVAQQAAAGSSGGAAVASAGAPATAAAAAGSSSSSSGVSSGGGSTGRPYRLSARLAVPTEESGAPKGVALSRDRATKLGSMLSELQVPPRLHCPTPVACDLYDALRRDIVVLLSLQKLVERGRQDVVQMQQQLAASVPSATPSSSSSSSSSAAAEGGDGSGAPGEGGSGGDGAGAGDADAKAPAGDKSKRKGGGSGGARKRPRK